MDCDVDRSKKVLIRKIEDVEEFGDLIIVCAVGVIGAFPDDRDKCKEFIDMCYDTFLPPGTLDMIKAKARKEE